MVVQTTDAEFLLPTLLIGFVKNLKVHKLEFVYILLWKIFIRVFLWTRSLFTPTHYKTSIKFMLILSWQRSVSYRNQSIDFLFKSMDWFLYDMALCH